MPIYEYVCLDCREEFEQVRLMKDADSPISCQKCASQHTSRKLSMFFASSGGKSVAGTSSDCGTCSSHACSTCRH
jgi:putative FmdB family regulatory protein